MKKLFLILFFSTLLFPAYSQRLYPIAEGQNCQLKVLSKTELQSQNAKASLSSSPPIVRIAYVVPSNRTPQDNYQQNLQFAIEMAQVWYRDNMQQNGFGSKTFIYETEDGSKRPKIHLVNVPQSDSNLRGNNGYELFENTKNAAKDAGLSIDADGEVWLLIPETHLQNPDGSFIGGLALGGGGGSGNNSGLAQLSSTVIQLFNPQAILDNTPYAGHIIPAWGPYPLVNEVSFVWFEGPTFSSVASSWLGALCHEVGHAFGLNHDFRHDNNFFGGLMFNGERGIRGSFFPTLYPTDYTRLEYGSALQLNESHYFNRDKIVSIAPSLSVFTSGPVEPTNGLLSIRFMASDSDNIAYAQLTDHDGNQIDEVSFNDLNVDYTFKTPYYAAGESGYFTITVCDKQGNRTKFNTYITVANGFNQAPKAFLKILYPNAPTQPNSTAFDASSTVDENYDSFTTEFDFNNDGVFDTAPLDNKLANYTIPQAGPYLARIRVTDSHGDSFISSPVSGNYGKQCGIDPPSIQGQGDNKICEGTPFVLNAIGCYGSVSWSTGATTWSITVNPKVSTAYTVTCNYGCPNLISQPFMVNVFSDNLSLTGNAQSGLEKSSQTISSTQTIPNAANVLYSTGKSITFLPNFTAEKGSTFSTLLQGCNYPIVNADYASALIDISKKINILSNDFNTNGSPITDLTKISLPIIAKTPVKGTVVVNTDGTITYSSYSGVSGTDTFSYSICNKNNNTQCSTATVTITIQDFVNPLQNANFETVVNFTSLPWQKAGWKPSQAVFSWLSAQGRNNSNCIKIFSGPTPENVQTNDVYVYQTVALNPNTDYTFRAWVKTENINSGKGASLALVNGNAWPPSSIGLTGTNDWTQLSLSFNSGVSGIITLSCRLGYTNADSSGTAYFDDLTIVPQ